MTRREKSAARSSPRLRTEETQRARSDEGRYPDLLVLAANALGTLKALEFGLGLLIFQLGSWWSALLYCLFVYSKDAGYDDAFKTTNTSRGGPEEEG
jgi:hypothetical protein